MKVFPEIKNSFYDVLSIRPTAYTFIRYLEQKSNLLLFGGCIREYYDNKFTIIPRDFDIVLSDLEHDLDFLFQKFNCIYKQNKFGGYKVKLDDLQFDIWEIQNTWAFKEKKVHFQKLLDLNKTVFLNIDGVFYDLNRGLLFDDGFSNAISTREIDIVLTANPYPELNLARAFRYKYKYNLQFSHQLQYYFDKWLDNFENKIYGINYLKDIEMKRYKSSIIDWNYEIDSI
ncbi:hypothetical protein [Neobacillus sp. PS3-40]|uniref:hypothetical protein n=1 Tax=Neobacillus sp. PS3-40 TaxID=3070679 RepID=UPI0027DFD676|nr:hypothetical protein [Neobacillus sp. PS3-40]WML44337.1 hypothetical protein RCG20_21655 [Neobacillus sp. PS3-40]